MATLKNAKWERFAHGLFAGLSADEAYEAAGYAPNRGNAARLKANESILKRLAELQERASEKAEWTAADRLEALKRIADAAEKAEPRVAVSAIAEANKMQGSHAPEKREHTGPNGGPIQTQTLDANKLSTATLKEILSARNEPDAN